MSSSRLVLVCSCAVFGFAVLTQLPVLISRGFRYVDWAQVEFIALMVLSIITLFCVVIYYVGLNRIPTIVLIPMLIITRFNRKVREVVIDLLA